MESIPAKYYCAFARDVLMDRPVRLACSHVVDRNVADRTTCPICGKPITFFTPEVSLECEIKSFVSRQPNEFYFGKKMYYDGKLVEQLLQTVNNTEQFQTILNKILATGQNKSFVRFCWFQILAKSKWGWSEKNSYEFLKNLTFFMDQIILKDLNFYLTCPDFYTENLTFFFINLFELFFFYQTSQNHKFHWKVCVFFTNQFSSNWISLISSPTVDLEFRNYLNKLGYILRSGTNHYYNFNIFKQEFDQLCCARDKMTIILMKFIETFLSVLIDTTSWFSDKSTLDLAHLINSADKPLETKKMLCQLACFKLEKKLFFQLLNDEDAETLLNIKPVLQNIFFILYNKLLYLQILQKNDTSESIKMQLNTCEQMLTTAWSHINLDDTVSLCNLIDPHEHYFLLPLLRKIIFLYPDRTALLFAWSCFHSWTVIVEFLLQETDFDFENTRLINDQSYLLVALNLRKVELARLLLNYSRIVPTNDLPRIQDLCQELNLEIPVLQPLETSFTICPEESVIILTEESLQLVAVESGKVMKNVHLHRGHVVKLLKWSQYIVTVSEEFISLYTNKLFLLHEKKRCPIELGSQIVDAVVVNNNLYTIEQSGNLYLLVQTSLFKDLLGQIVWRHVNLRSIKNSPKYLVLCFTNSFTAVDRDNNTVPFVNSVSKKLFENRQGTYSTDFFYSEKDLTKSFFVIDFDVFIVDDLNGTILTQINMALVVQGNKILFISMLDDKIQLVTPKMACVLKHDSNINTIEWISWVPSNNFVFNLNLGSTDKNENFQCTMAKFIKKSLNELCLFFNNREKNNILTVWNTKTNKINKIVCNSFILDFI